MTRFLHKLAEALRAREQYLEDHSTHPAFEIGTEGNYKRDYDNLVTELKDFSSRISDLKAKGEDFDEHFEREISNEHQKLMVKIDTWAKNLEDQ